MFKTILVAMDGSDHADKALATACALATELGSDLHLVHVPELELIAMAVGVAPAVLPYPERDVQEAGRVLIAKATGAAEGAGCKIASSHVEQGDPAHVIQERAKAIGADLLITGRRGLGKISGLLMGSVSQKLGQVVPCAHMTVI